MARSWSYWHLRGWSSAERRELRQAFSWVLWLSEPCQRSSVPVHSPCPVCTNSARRSTAEGSLCLRWNHSATEPRQPRIHWRHMWRHGLPVTSVVSGQVKQGGGLKGRRRRRVGNLVHCEHKRIFFNMNNTIFSLTSGGSCYSTGGGKPEQGAESHLPLTLTTEWRDILVQSGDMPY